MQVLYVLLLPFMPSGISKSSQSSSKHVPQESSESWLTSDKGVSASLKQELREAVRNEDCGTVRMLLDDGRIGIDTELDEVSNPMLECIV